MAGPGDSVTGLIPSHDGRAAQSEHSYMYQSQNNSSVGDHYSLSPDPQTWGAHVSPSFKEPDDALHNPEVRNGKFVDRIGGFSPMTKRGVMNLGCLGIIVAGLLTLFIAYPIITHVQNQSNKGEQLGVNSTGQVPEITPTRGGIRSLIDTDTPDDALKKKDWINGKEWDLIFSDEFNVDGRTFYPGDDPYWEAVDLHYWGTNNKEWYDPSRLITKDGDLVVSLIQTPNHGLELMGGMMSTWNKFCFTGGLIETSVTLPGANNVMGLWPAVWTMGNLGRAGYGASLDGMWPYSYDACDVGTMPNQTLNGLPAAALKGGWESSNYELSYLPGQRLSRCTCEGESHPGPKHSDGSYVGRSAPEIDMFEAQVKENWAEVSLSGQFAPYNHDYLWDNSTENFVIGDHETTELNTYKGAAYQQAVSGVTRTNPECYQLNGGCKSVYGFQYKPGFDDAYITWIVDNKHAWTMKAGAVREDPITEISARPVPQEPLYILINLGLSENFGFVDYEHIVYPAIMTVDYIRVYQDPDLPNIGCDPVDFPTQAYINMYEEAYHNPNLTTWTNDYGQEFPRNSWKGEC